MAGTAFGLWVGLIAGLATAVTSLVLTYRRPGAGGAPAHPSGEQVLAIAYPHSRREMKHELIFLTPCMFGMVLGWCIGRFMIAPSSTPGIIVQALGASFAGYLMGGGLIWGIRILGTFGFGREAMGLGDVHLLAAIGAVVGWFDPILIFFIAPFSGLLWALVSIGIASVFKRVRRELPYGPHLAVATLVVLLYRPGLRALWNTYLPTVPWPTAGLCNSKSAPSAQGASPSASPSGVPRGAPGVPTQPRD